VKIILIALKVNNVARQGFVNPKMEVEAVRYKEIVLRIKVV
jgi:hypothetical protein